MAWTIKGDPDVAVTTVAGVTYGLDATVRTFADLNITSPVLKLQSLADDTFTYSVKTENAKGKGTIVPKMGQRIELFESGVRRFKGHITKPRLGLKSLAVTAVGPWWWMAKIKLSGAFKDSTGVTSQRSSYVFPTQGLRLTLRTLLNLADDAGVPMSRITDANEADRIHTAYTMLKTTFSDVSFAAALSEIMAMIPDAVAWWDYTDPSPALNIHRRGSMTPISYAVGATGTVRVESAEIQPRLDQEVKRVELRYMKRQAVTGYPQWARSAHGTAETGKVQIITVSGPETVEILPKDDFDSVTLKTEQAVLGLSTAMKLDPVIKDAIAKYGALKYTIAAAAVPYTGWHRIVSGETADWMRKDYGLKTKDLRVTGWVAANYSNAVGAGYGPGGSYLKSIGRLRTSKPNSVTYKWELFVDYTIPVINLSYASKTTVRKKWDYDFLAPPENLAENLRDAQNWLPWEGPVVILRPDLNGYNGLQRTFNLTESNPDHADMNAMVRSITYDITRNRVTWDLGAPSRIDPGNLISKLRRSPQDNIIWL